MAERHRVATPTELNLSHLHRQPLMPFASASAPPPSTYNRIVNPSGAVNVYPWGWEIVNTVEGSSSSQADSFLITYVALADPGELLLLACLDSWLDPIYELMTGADFGDQVTPLVAKHWPETFRLMCNGNGMAQSPGILRVTTASTQWAVGTFFVDVSTEEEFIIPEAPKEQLTAAVVAVVGDLLGFPANLPGLVPILGGDDRTSRRMRSIASILSNIGSLGG